MKSRVFLGLCLIACFCLAVAAAHAGKADKTQLVDSGSFGIFVSGKRVATETFSVEQQAGGSFTKSAFKLEDGSNKPNQSSELEFTSSGELRRYEWHDLGPDKAQVVVSPNNEFLVERMVANPTAKPFEQPFLLPSSTMILDDYSFVHRELLAWRYLAGVCKAQEGKMQCRGERADFGVLVPRQHSSMMVSIEYGGREKITVHGQERELNRLNLKGEAGDWSLWIDDQYRLIRILVASDNTEVVRD